MSKSIEIGKNPSLLITGASASGKTTLAEVATGLGYVMLPIETTRQLRPGEVEGIHLRSVRENEFARRFRAGSYIETDFLFTLLNSTGVRYGTPNEWLPKLEAGGHIANPVSIAVAETIMGRVESGSTTWIHLVCEERCRRQRLADRKICEAEIEARMTTGDSIITPQGVLTFDTSTMTPVQILQELHITQDIKEAA